MKHLRILLLMLVTLVACDQTPKEDPLSITVKPETLSFAGEDDSYQPLVVTTDGYWTATPSASWIHMDKTEGSGKASVSVSVDVNDQNSSRSSTIEFVSSKAGKQEKASVTINQASSEKNNIVPNPDLSGEECAATTYQLLIYSFSDSDGDGIGDFKGIQNKLDYLKSMGVRGLWLSPMHPADSYHGYDVTDYFAVNPQYGSEADFKNLMDAAHARGIEIYLDYVLNHSGKGHPWFREALADASSPYRDYYFFSANPSSDYKNFPMLKGTTYQSSEWKSVTSGSPKLTIKKTSEAVTNGTATWNMYMWQDGGSDKTVKFVAKGDGTYYLVMDINGNWGMLVRKYANWDNGSKFGAKSSNVTVQEGVPIDLIAEGADIRFTGNGRYRLELTNVSTETLYYMGCFSDWMPDLNYGDVSKVTDNACFKDLAASADKWIKMGIDGLRLDAVKHICGGISSFNHNSNRTFLKAWYEHCNATFKAAGHTGNIYMVAEEWDSHSTEKTYYTSLTSCFEFDYGYKLRDMLNNRNSSGFVSTVSGFVKDHNAQREDAVTSIFLSNHDQNRFANEIQKNLDKQKQAGAILLSSPGKPFIYQGEELGYWGDKGSGDEYVRTPILWDKAGKECAKKGVNNKVDNSMLKADISVEAQEADENSILNVYKSWGRVRNAYKSLGQGEMTESGITGSTIASWYMTYGSEKMLVIHNVANTEKTVTVSDDMSHPMAVLGTVYTREKELTLGANSSVIFKVQ